MSEKNNEYPIPIKLTVTEQDQQYVMTSNFSVFVTTSLINNLVMGYLVIGLVVVVVFALLFRRKTRK